MGGKSSTTIGYRYFMSLLNGLCRGPVDEIVELQAGGLSAFKGSIKSSFLGFINKPDLFGGKKKEGGLQGPIMFLMGDEDQVLPGAQTYNGTGAYASQFDSMTRIRGLLKDGSSFKLPSIKASIATGLVPEFRGVVTVWFDGMVTCLSPYVKEWSWRVRRYRKGWWQDNCWYPEKALVTINNGEIKAVNGAHIVYECLTNPQWGRGLPASKLDDNSFVYAANTLCSEGFGLCLAWYRKEDIDVFIQKVIDLIGAVLYTDRETGLINLRLVRNDYDADALPLFTPTSGLLSIKDDDSASSTTSYNEIIGSSTDPTTNTQIQMRAQNLASFQSQQSVSSNDVDYTGIPTKALLGRVVLRDLRSSAVGLKKFVLTLDRRAWRIAPGEPFRISDPSKGIDSVVVRAGEIDDGNMVNGTITIKVAQDVFGLPDTSFVTPTDGSWTPPSQVAAPATVRRLIEAGYRDIYRLEGASVVDALSDEATYIGQLAKAPTATSTAYELATMAEGETDFVERAEGSFTGNAKTVGALGPLDASVTLTDLATFSTTNVGEALLIDNEVVRLDALDEDTLVATITRGVADTIPQSHVIGSEVWTVDDDLASDERSYAEGETVYTKVLTTLSTDTLSPDDAPTDTITLTGRQGLPYPPAAVKVDGEEIFTLTGTHAEPVITWASRNRRSQADNMLGYLDASVAGEEGQTYTIRVYDADGTLLRTADGITDLTWTYTAEMREEDGSPLLIRVELESARSGLASWQHYSFSIALVAGWSGPWSGAWGD